MASRNESVEWMTSNTAAEVKTVTVEKIHFAIADQLKAGVPYIDALCEYSAQNNIEIETLAAIVKKSEVIKTKLREEALSLRLIKKDEDERRLCD